MSKIEEKLFQDRYQVDSAGAHITIKDAELCMHCAEQQCAVCCPAGCYTQQGNGRLVLITDGCLECGTCRIVCDQRNLDWEWPRGGFGILFKFG